MNSNAEVWIAEDDRSLRWVMEKALSRNDMAVRSFEDGGQLLAALRLSTPEIIISDIRMPGIDGLELLKEIHLSHSDIPVIITTAHSDLDSAVAAYQGGAFEYLPKPFDLDELVDVTRRAKSFSQEQKSSLEIPEATSVVQEIIGEAPAMQEVFRAIGRLSNSNITVLINGESGTGKELVAQALHKHSPRKNAKFIALNMAAIPRDLIESELFGHEKGSFTGASQRREGRFEQADGGTLFLDEIGDMPGEAQTRLLRILADGEFYRVGGQTAIKVDVRIIAATHQNLEELVAENRFREDLFHSLN
ncbi:MAG: sigma 54-interacting transcriptional regulator, partial [Porticoccaceae bacterium]